MRSDIINRLEALGFTTYEAKAYYALLQKHPANGYEVSKISLIPPSKIYETLQKLKNRGAIIDSQSDTVMYLPIEPEVLFSRIKDETERAVNDVLRDLSGVRQLEAFDLTWNITGAQGIHEKTNEIIARAQSEIYLSIWPEHSSCLEAGLAQAMERGVRIIAATFGPCCLSAQRIINLEACAENLSLRARAKLSTVVCDNNEIVIGEFAEKQEASKGVWTKTPVIVFVAKEYIKHDIMVNLLANHMGEDAYRDFCQKSGLIHEMRAKN